LQKEDEAYLQTDLNEASGYTDRTIEFNGTIITRRRSKCHHMTIFEANALGNVL